MANDPITAPPALRPPAWAEKYRWHWLSAGDHISILQWRAGTWRLWDSSTIFYPEDLEVHGWRYIGPADPSARVIDPENAAMVEHVARGIRSQKLRRIKKPKSIPEIMIPLMTDDEWKLDVDLAGAALIALKEMP